MTRFFADIRRHKTALVTVAFFVLVAVGFMQARTSSTSDMTTDTGAIASSGSSSPQPLAVRVPILVYHNVRPAPPRMMSAADMQYEVTPAQFSAQLEYLAAEGYASVGFSDLLAAQRGEITLPEKPIIITLDDGRDAQFEYALPLLRQHGFTATFFVFSNAVGRPGYLTWEQLKELRDSAMIIGSHTRYHPYLTKLEDDEELRAELEVSKRSLEDGIGAPVEFLAYPFGLYDERVVAASAAAGYLAARGLEHDSLHEPGRELELGSFITTGDLDYFKTILASP